MVGHRDIDKEIAEARAEEARAGERACVCGAQLADGDDDCGFYGCTAAIAMADAARAEHARARADRRRQYACAALTGLASRHHLVDHGGGTLGLGSHVIRAAWHMADAMIAEEERGDG